MNYLLNSLENTFKKCLETATRKNSDYSSAESPFLNIEACKNFGINPEHGILIRLSDKFARLSNLITTNKEIKVKDESINDTIEDAINYLAILKAYRDYKNEPKINDNERISRLL